MQPERRWNVRLPVAINIVIYYSGLGLIQGKTKNISLDGAYIETGRISLHHAGELELILYDPHDCSEQQRVRARIARLDDHGAGLVFQDIPLAAYDLIRKAMSRPGSNAVNETLYKITS